MRYNVIVDGVTLVMHVTNAGDKGLPKKDYTHSCKVLKILERA